MARDDDEGKGERRLAPAHRPITEAAHQDKSTAANGQQAESSTAGRMLCAGYGAVGCAPTITKDDPRPVLRPAFAWGDPPRTALLYPLCRPEHPPTIRRSVPAS